MWFVLIRIYLFFQDGKLVIAVVLPFKPFVERGGVNNRPLIDVEAFQSKSRHHGDQLETFVNAVHNRYYHLIG